MRMLPLTKPSGLGLTSLRSPSPSHGVPVLSYLVSAQGLRLWEPQGKRPPNALPRPWEPSGGSSEGTGPRAWRRGGRAAWVHNLAAAFAAVTRQYPPPRPQTCLASVPAPRSTDCSVYVDPETGACMSLIENPLHPHKCPQCLILAGPVLGLATSG